MAAGVYLLHLKNHLMSIIVKKRFDVAITAPDKVYSQSFELDKTITFIKGILLTADKEDLLYYRGSQKIEVNKQEIFPEDYASKLLMTGINISPNQRYYDTGNLPVGNGIVKIEYKDQNDTRLAFEQYRISIYLDCEQREL
jgi:hypothetical protein